MITVSEIWIYPVKSCKGCRLQEAELDSLGLVGDRRFLIVDRNGLQITQRTHPRLALLRPTLTKESLTIEAPEKPPLSIARHDASRPIRPAQVWGDANLQAADCGEEAAAWLSEYLAEEAHLVGLDERFERRVRKSDPTHPDHVSFADAAPLLVVSEESLHDLNDRLGERGEEPVPVDRFRPNLVFRGAKPFGEDTWPTFAIAQCQFRTIGASVRCVVTTTDQETLARGPEPLRTLAGFRRNPSKPSEVLFGQNVVNSSKSGVVRCGDEVRIL